jgi:predicted DNA-binding mobile mystery protein A
MGNRDIGEHFAFARPASRPTTLVFSVDIQEFCSTITEHYISICTAAAEHTHYKCAVKTERRYAEGTMRNEFKDLRRSQLDRSLSPFVSAKPEARPPRGWLRAVREGLGLSLEKVANKLGGVARSRILEFEEAEANDRISLRSLRRVAEAMDCELVYAIVPKSGTLTELADKLERDRVVNDVHRVARTMALEDQATNNTDEFIERKIKSRREPQ